MSTSLKLQTLGSVLVVGTYVAAESAAHWLSAIPGSELAWYLNLEVFRVFEHARQQASPLRHLFGPWGLLAGLAVLSLTLICGALQLRIAVGLLANFSLLFAGALAHAAYLGANTFTSASLVPIAPFAAHDFYLVSFVGAVALVAFATCHISFVEDIIKESSSPPTAAPTSA